MLESLFNKVTELKACSFIKQRLQHKCFHVNIAKFLRTSLFIKHLWWLLLNNRKEHMIYFIKSIMALNSKHIAKLQKQRYRSRNKETETRKTKT